MAAVKAPEKYEDISVALKPTFDEINSLVHSPEITVGDQIYKIELFLGGDYKVYNKYNSAYIDTCCLNDCLPSCSFSS